MLQTPARPAPPLPVRKPPVVPTPLRAATPAAATPAADASMAAPGGRPRNERMSALILAVNQLQDACTLVCDAESAPLSLGLSLPMIAVVGSQSAGKSSVLENFVGREFLPRGSGIVTRRPLVLQLVTATTQQEYAEFVHCPQQRFTDFDLVRREIEAETERETGHNKGISARPINLKIVSPYVLNLTLVDLPGLTKVAVGDQPKDIDVQIRRMVELYVTRPNCLILAVSPANADLANSDALRLARDVDPSGQRTIGVLTKLDLMDEGTDARDVLENRVYPLKLGFVGVVNRSQRDIDQRKSVEASLGAERQFFAQHKSYRRIADRQGTGYLQRLLTEVLADHIAQCLPALRQQLEAEQARLKLQIGESDELAHARSDPARRAEVVVRILQRARDILSMELEGDGRDLSLDSLNVGALIEHVFRQNFPKALENVAKDDIRPMIKIALSNTNAIYGGMFESDRAFRQVCSAQIETFRKPSYDCVASVMDLMQVAIDKLGLQLDGYDTLVEEVRTRLCEHLHNCEAVAKQRIDYFVDCHTSFINVNNPDFGRWLRENKAAREKLDADTKDDRKRSPSEDRLSADPPHVQPTAGRPLPPPPKSAEGSFRSYLPVENRSALPKPHESPSIAGDSTDDSAKSLLDRVNKYVSIIRDIIEDAVPKIIVHCLILPLPDFLPARLLGLLHSEYGGVEQFLDENDQTKAARERFVRAYDVVVAALDIVRGVERDGLLAPAS